MKGIAYPLSILILFILLISTNAECQLGGIDITNDSYVDIYAWAEIAINDTTSPNLQVISIPLFHNRSETLEYETILYGNDSYNQFYTLRMNYFYNDSLIKFNRMDIRKFQRSNDTPRQIELERFNNISINTRYPNTTTLKKGNITLVIDIGVRGSYFGNFSKDEIEKPSKYYTNIQIFIIISLILFAFLISYKIASFYFRRKKEDRD